MADVNVSIDLSAEQAIAASNKFSNALKNVDTSVDALHTSLEEQKQVSKNFIDSIDRTMSSLKAANKILRDSFNIISRQSVTSKSALSSFKISAQDAFGTVTEASRTFSKVISSSESATTDAFSAYEKLTSLLDVLSKKTSITAADLERVNRLQADFAQKKSKALDAREGLGPSAESFKGISDPQFLLLQKQKESAKAELDRITVRYNLASNATQQLKESTQRLGDELVRLKEIEASQGKIDDSGKTTKKIKELETAYDELIKKTALAERVQEKHHLAVANSFKVYSAINSQVTKTQNTYAEYANRIGEVNTKVKQLSDSETTLASKLDLTNKKISSQKFSELFSGIGGSVTGAIHALNTFRIAFNLAFAATGVGAATSVVADFDQTVANMKSIIQGAGKDTTLLNYEMAGLKETMNELGATSRYTASEAGQGMVYMAQAGLEYGELVASARDVLDLAVASDTSLARSSEIVIQAMRTFGIEAKDAWQVTNSLAVGAQTSVTSIEDLSVALRYVGPIAHTLGMRIDEVVASLGTLADSGLQSTMAGTGLRRVISEIINPTKKARKILDGYGLTIDKLNIRARGFRAVMQSIIDANISIGDTFAIWGDRGTPALRTLIDNVDNLDHKLKVVNLDNENFASTVGAMRSTREDTLQGQWKASVSAVQEFMIKFSEYLNAINSGKGVLGSFASMMRDFNKNLAENVSSLLGSVIGAGVFFVAFKKLYHPITALSAAFDNGKKSIAAYFDTGLKSIATADALEKAQNSLAASTSRLSGVYYAAHGGIIKFLIAHQNLAKLVVLLKSAFSGLLQLGISVGMGVIVGKLVEMATAADHGIEVMNKLSASIELYSKDANGVAKVTSDFNAALLQMSDTAVQEKILEIKDNINALRKTVVDSFSKLNFYDMVFALDPSGEVVIKSNVENILSKVFKTKNPGSLLREAFRDFDAGNPAAVKDLLHTLSSETTESKLELFPKDQQEQLLQLKKLLQGLILSYDQLKAARERAMIQQEDMQRAEAEKRKAEAARTKLNELQEEALVHIRGIQEPLSSRDFAKLENEYDRVVKKTLELNSAFKSEDARKYFALVKSSIDDFDKYFTFDPSTMLVKLNETTRKAYHDFLTAGTVDEQNAARDILEALHITPEEIEKDLESINRLKIALDELREAQINSAFRDIDLKNQLDIQLTAVDDTAKAAKAMMLDLFSTDELSNFEIVFGSSIEHVEMYMTEAGTASAVLAEQVSTALDIVYNRLSLLNSLKFDQFAQKVEQITTFIKAGLDSSQISRVQSFASSAGVSLSTYIPETDSFTDEKVNNLWKQDQANQAALHPKKTPVDKTAKLFADVENELQEMRLKYQQYYAEIKLGSTMQVDLEKLKLEQFKESANLLAKAKSLGISESDARISGLKEQIALVYQLRMAEGTRKLKQETRMAPLKTAKSEAQVFGGKAYAASYAVMGQSLQDLIEDQNVFVKGSKGWEDTAGKIAEKEAEIYALNQEMSKERLQANLELAEEVGTVDEIYQAKMAIHNLEIGNLLSQKSLVDTAIKEAEVRGESVAKLKEESDLLQAQIDAKDAKKEHDPHDMYGGMKATIGQMIATYDEYTMMGEIVQNVSNEMINSIVKFCDTGKFELSEFTHAIGIMLVELTTKMMLYKTLGSIMGFASGGTVDVTAEANGDLLNITHAKKYARGGLLTSPTLFNTTSGTALAGEAGYEHIMPAARLSNGKWGVYAEGMGSGSNQIVINNTVNVEGGSTGNSEDDEKLAQTISEKMRDSVTQAVQRELANQMRSGGLLNHNGRARW